ncbi:MAG TPA: hypothetical protein VGG54_22770 [Trebonia sp.]
MNVINREIAEVVLYHGSQRRSHGEWLLAGACICNPCAARVLSGGEGRWELADVRGPNRITCVRRESFTPYSELPQAAPAPVHKTTTTPPSGYVENGDGTRRFDKRGRVMRDRFSFARCTCGWVSGGADRAEARANARRHRDEQAALQQAETDAALAALRAKLEGPTS